MRTTEQLKVSQVGLEPYNLLSIMVTWKRKKKITVQILILKKDIQIVKSIDPGGR